MASYRDLDLLHTGKIEVIVGPMFSGKSTELLRRVRRYATRCDTAIIKYKGDTRYSEDQFSTHDLQMMKATACTKLMDAYDEIKNGEYDVIGIDEGQFYPDLREACEKWAKEGKVVIVATLDGDYRRRPFGHVSSLLPLVEDWVKLRAICECGLDASFTGLKLEADPDLAQSNEVAVGGTEKYTPMCRGCHDKFLKALAKKERNESMQRHADTNAKVFFEDIDDDSDSSSCDMQGPHDCDSSSCDDHHDVASADFDRLVDRASVYWHGIENSIPTIMS